MAYCDKLSIGKEIQQPLKEWDMDNLDRVNYNYFGTKWNCYLFLTYENTATVLNILPIDTLV